MMEEEEIRKSEVGSRNAGQSDASSPPAEASKSDLPVSQSPITDSPWFWLLTFSGMSLVALLAIGPKYALRQGGLENRFLNRETALQWQGEEIESDEAVKAAQMPRSREDRELLIPLKPLFLGIGALLLLGLAGLSFNRLRHRV
jgi:hypothetical protein